MTVNYRDLNELATPLMSAVPDMISIIEKTGGMRISHSDLTLFFSPNRLGVSEPVSLCDCFWLQV